MASLREQRDVVAIGSFAMALRLFVNFVVHPPMSEIRSDMAGYVQRAEALLKGDFGPDPRASFYPFGTHTLVFALEWLFGSQGKGAIGFVWAAMGGLAVVFSVLTAKRLFPASPWIARVVGLSLAVEPAWLQLGSYVLSEAPTMLAISASAFVSLRLIDEGKARDAIWLGVIVALGATFRPQIYASLVMLGLHVVVRRSAWSKVKPRLVVLVLAPVVVGAALSTARMHYHTGHYRVLPTNGPFNYVFGRCHCAALSATKTSGSRFEPPSFKALLTYREHYGVEPFPPLDPALGPELKLEGDLWDPAPAEALARRCVEKTGYAKQVSYAGTHLILLWAYNLVWPTRGAFATVGSVAYSILFVPGLLVGLVLAFRRAHARELALAAQIFGLFATAALFFGEARMRAPYDGVIAILAVGAYAHAIAWWRARRRV